jgi:hypothetical protein
MMFAIMLSSHTHRFSWRPWKPFIALTVLVMIGLGTLAPIAAPFAQAQPAPASTTAAAPPSLPAADPTLCGIGNGTDVLVTGRCLFFNVIAEVLLLIASLLGRILIFMVDILIAFASYNDFGNTIVVTKGWPIVRDIVNMFFIIILLVSAFATVIGYDEGNFHYKRVLPKLLLMAVLINFSKTLILLLVDFSQVLMLTFVNAFAQAGPGNLVSALKIDSALKFAPVNAAAGTSAVGAAITNTVTTGVVDPLNLILAIMLAIFMLSISLGVVIIMVAYLIFRVVGLWVALILSPIALFATALPGRLQKGLDNFTGKYWQRLTALLTGGPVMAFFLWLTFAVTQGSTGAGGLAPALKFNVTNTAATFLTTIGNSQDIASFIVGITLMLMGLDAAVSSASAVSDTLGGFAKKTASASKALGSLAATAPLLAGYYGTRGTGRYIDRRMDISGKAATGAAATIGQIPILRSFVRKPLSDLMTRNKRMDMAESKELQAGLEGMSPTQRAIMSSATPSSRIATKGQRAAYAQQLMEQAGPKNAQAIKDELMPKKIEQFTAMKQKELEAQGLKDAELQGELGKARREIESRASQAVDGDVAALQSESMENAMTTAKVMGDKDMVRSIEEQYKKNPQLIPERDRVDMAKTLLADKKALNGMSDQGKGNVGTIVDLFTEAKIMQPDGSMDRAKMDAFKDKITDKGTLENVEMVERYISAQKTAGVPTNRKELEGMMIGKDAKGKTRMLRKSSMTPVVTEAAKQAELAFAAKPTDIRNIENMIEQVDAEKVFKKPESWDAYKAETAKDMGKLAGFSMVAREVPHPTDPSKKVTEYTPSLERSVVDGGLQKFEQAMKKIDDMSATQQDDYLAMATDQRIPEILVTAKRAGYSDKGRNKVIDAYIGKLLRVEKAVKESGASNPSQQKAIDALTKLRAAVEKKENSGFGSAWRQKLEPKELE